LVESADNRAGAGMAHDDAAPVAAATLATDTVRRQHRHAVGDSKELVSPIDIEESAQACSGVSMVLGGTHLRQRIRWPEISRGWCSESAVGEHRDCGAGLLHYVKIKIGQEQTGLRTQ
jgi:hypothetical protein